MEVTLKLNDKRAKAKISFAQSSDFGFAKSWRTAIEHDGNPVRIDSVDFAELAIKRYEASSALGIYANSRVDFNDHIAANPKVEVGGFVLLRCDWFPFSDVIGCCHFRRTWCNKVILDYLSAHPFIAREKEETPTKVRGAGVALIYFLTQILKDENCTALWGEATSLSALYYKNLFALERVEDLIYATRQQVLAFADKCERNWSAGSEVLSQSDASLDAIYAIEAEHSPFVGSKTAVFNPSKRLAFRFLQLPYHKQLQISRELNLEFESGAIARKDLARNLFHHTQKQNQLPALWALVQSEYPDSVAEHNPFEMT